ncbi:hypothetical protein E2C01_015532 [Portunus trituberculatus]|uniref:Uncharacterized protein n=1 Tax=Portunus trituberculatus TaxID=210409 RepID=A0A5B7DMU5_PORTR|nr:hypothetical protein [Portunus trituberculatus]
MEQLRRALRSARKITVSALVNSATVPEYRPGRPPGLPCSTQTAVLLSEGSKGHLATPFPIPGTCSRRAKWVKLVCGGATSKIH